MVFACLCVYGMACSCCLSTSFGCFVCDVLLRSCLFVVFGVYVLFVVCCVAVCCPIGLSCVYGLVLLSCFRFCFVVYVGLNAFPVSECILYGPSLRCSFLVV